MTALLGGSLSCESSQDSADTVARAPVSEPVVTEGSWRTQVESRLDAGNAAAALDAYYTGSAEYRDNARDLGSRVLEARSRECMAAGEWDCAVDKFRAASALVSQPLTTTRDQLAAALEQEAKRQEKQVATFKPGDARLTAARAAVASWAQWSAVSGKPQPASVKRLARVVSQEESAAERGLKRQEAKSSSPAPTLERECCKHCSSGCPCGDSCISCSKTCHRGPGCAC